MTNCQPSKPSMINYENAMVRLLFRCGHYSNAPTIRVSTVDENAINTRDTTGLQQTKSPSNFSKDLEEKEKYNFFSTRE